MIIPYAARVRKKKARTDRPAPAGFYNPQEIRYYDVRKRFLPCRVMFLTDNGSLWVKPVLKDLLMDQNERFNHIYTDTRDELLRFLTLRTNAAPEAEDLFQESYRRLYVRMERGVLPILDPKRYLFSIAKKLLSRYYRDAAERKMREQPINEETELVPEAETVDERMFRMERMESVWAFLKTEPELNRRAFILFYGYDVSQKEIGTALGISEEAVRQRIYRTRSRIRALLGSEQNDQERKEQS